MGPFCHSLRLHLCLEGTRGWANDTTICVLASEYDEISYLMKSATAYSYDSSS